jgi:hypothetical protein
MEQERYNRLLTLLEGIRDERRTAANTATRVGTALIEMLDAMKEGSISEEQFLELLLRFGAELFLSKKHADAATGLIDFLAGAEFGEFVEGLYTGSGARIDKDGNAEVESLRVRSFLEVLELIINRLSAIEGDQVLTECDTIEQVEYVGTDESGDGIYKLTLKNKWDGYISGQVQHNILRGIINTLPGSQAGASQVRPEDSVEEDVGTNKYYTSWMRVTETDISSGHNIIKVVMYPGKRTYVNDEGEEVSERIVPAGKNFPPCSMMNIARWGYAVDYDPATMPASQEKYIRQRQTFLFFSSTDGGSIMKFTHVNKPILEDYMYGFTLGELPEAIAKIAEKYGYSKDRDILFVPQILTSNLIVVPPSDIPVVPKHRFNDKGEWKTGVAYRHEVDSGETDFSGNPYLDTDDAWHNGCKWRCMQTQPVKDGSGNDIYEIPRWNSSSWAFLEGNAELTLRFSDSEGRNLDGLKVRVGQIDERVFPRVYFGYTDITADFADSDFSWSRVTGNGDPTEADQAWTNTHGTGGTMGELHITDTDFPAQWDRGKMRFVCRVVVADGKGTQVAVENYMGL